MPSRVVLERKHVARWGGDSAASPARCDSDLIGDLAVTQIDRNRRRYGAGAVAALAGLLLPTVGQFSDPVAAAPIVKYAANSAVVISEVSCETDWVELSNTDTKLPAKIANWFIADSLPIVVKSSFRFGKTAVIKPGARVVVKASSLPFKIGCGSDNIYLNRTSTATVDRITVPNLNPGFTWGRVDNKWMANSPTMAKANVAAPADAVVDRAAWMYDNFKEYKIRLTVDPANLQKLVDTPKDYVPAKFQMEDPTGAMLPAAGPMDVGLRVKGGVGSRTHPIYGEGGLDILRSKVSLKIKFNYSVKGQDFFGLKKLTLNNMVQDRSLVHEAMSYALFREMGINASRTGFANVYINDSLRGLFLNLEPYDDIAVAWREPQMQHVYEGTQYRPAVGDYSQPEFTDYAIGRALLVDEGDEKNLNDLRALVAAITETSTLSPKLYALLDIDRMATQFAVEKFISHWDGYSGNVPWAPNNNFMMSNAQGRFQLMPWGVDGTWQFDFEPGLSDSGTEVFDSATSILFPRCLRDDYCASVYRLSLAKVAALGPKYSEFGQSMFTAHTASRVADTVRLGSEADSQWNWSETKRYVAQRPDDVARYLQSVVTGTLRWQPVTNKLAKGTAFTAQQLNAYSDVAGTFSYSVALGTKLAVGKYDVTVTFTPSDGTSPAQTATQTFIVG